MNYSGGPTNHEDRYSDKKERASTSSEKRVKFEDGYSTPQKQGKGPWEEEKYGLSGMKTAEKSPDRYGSSFNRSNEKECYGMKGELKGEMKGRQQEDNNE
eukprot:CAMPEP_0170545344 /NCGR_PEP_ID=MMETSP0211-20121228/3767_1 /TAXON_ID=311385 /ORGANISM="Pseudokeronopsis sp., Strain OXSARD2" /LENGTH=99 /DNA_ID=CAMNT_0010849223 /DNA_START=890 /DNA_END=1189 /DNA_ORIENTATION=+